MGLSINKIVGAAVVLCMSVLPSKIRHKQSLVDDEAHNIVECLRGRECTMTTLMSKNPMPSPNCAFPKGEKVPTKEPDPSLSAEKV